MLLLVKSILILFKIEPHHKPPYVCEIVEGLWQIRASPGKALILHDLLIPTSIAVDDGSNLFLCVFLLKTVQYD